MACCPLQLSDKGPPKLWPLRQPVHGSHKSGHMLRGSDRSGEAEEGLAEETGAGGTWRPVVSGGECGLRWAKQGGPSTESVPVLPPVSLRQLLSEPQCPRLCIGFSSGIGGRSAPVVGSTHPHARCDTRYSLHACAHCACCPNLCLVCSRLQREKLDSSFWLAFSSPVSSYIILRADVWGRNCYDSFSRTSNKAPRGVATCPRSHRGSGVPWPQGLCFGSGPPAFLQEAALVL